VELDHDPQTYLTNCIRQNVYNLLMRGGHNTLAIDFNDPVADTDPTALCYPSSHETANLEDAKYIKVVLQTRL